MLWTTLKKFLNDRKTVLLILGNSASGKTFYCKQLVTQIAASDEHKDITAVYLPLNRDKTIVDRAIDQHKLAVNQKILFIFDGYEELGALQNIYQYFNLMRWPNAKVIVTCRPEYFANVRDYRVYFVPFVRERFEFNLLEEVALTASKDSLLSIYRDKPPATLMTEWDAYHQDKYKLTVAQKQQALEYCIAVAREMQKQKVTIIVYRPSSGLFNRSGSVWQKYFEQMHIAIRMAAPIIKTGRYQYEFISSDLITYFVSLKPIDKITAIEKSKDNATKEDQKKVVAKTALHLANHYLNFRLITRDVNMLSLLADRVWQSERFKRELFELVLASRDDKEMAKAAANAITILNMARVSFAGMDLTGIKIPSANLNKGNFDHTNLSCADLENVSLIQAWLRKTKLSGSCMQGVEFAIEPFLPHSEAIRFICYSANTNILATVSDKVRLWNTNTFELIKEIKIASSKVFFTFDDNKLVSVFAKTASIFNLRSNSMENKVGMDVEIVSSDFNQNGDLALGCHDSSVRLWNANQNTQVVTLYSGHDIKKRANTGSGAIVSFIDEKELVVGDINGRVRILNLISKKLIEFSKHDGEIKIICFDKKSKLVASACNNAIIIQKLHTNMWSHTFITNSPTTSLCFHPDRDILVSGHFNKEICFWDLQNDRQLKHIRGSAGIVSGLISTDKLLIASSMGMRRNTNRIQFWNFDGILNSYDKDKMHSGVVDNVIFNRDVEIIVSTSNAEIALWNFKTGFMLDVLDNINQISCVYFHPFNKELLLVGSLDIKIWNILSRKRLITLNAGEEHGFVNSLTLDRSNKYLIAAHNKVVIFWDINSRKKVFIWRNNCQTLCFHPETGIAVAVDERGILYFSELIGYKANLLCIKDGSMQEQRAGIDLSHILIKSICFSPDGKILAYGDMDGRVFLCNTRDVKRNKFVARYNFHCHSASVMGTCINKDNTLLVTGGYDSKVIIWKIIYENDSNKLCKFELKKLLTINETHGAIRAVCFFGDNFLGSASSDGSVKLWRLEYSNQSINAYLFWRNPYFFFGDEAQINNVVGLNNVQIKLFKQHNAIQDSDSSLDNDSNEPAVHLSAARLLKQQHQRHPVFVQPTIGGFAEARAGGVIYSETLQDAVLATLRSSAEHVEDMSVDEQTKLAITLSLNNRM